MIENQTRRVRSSTGRSAAILLTAGLAVAGIAGCGSDDEPSAQEKYCEAGDSLRSSVDALVGLDLVAEGTDGLNSAVDAVKGDVEELRDAASDAAADDVSVLEQSVDDLEGVPTSTKADLRGAPLASRLARGLRPEQLVRRTTEGSTGEPFAVYRTWFEERLLQAIRLREMRSLGLRVRPARTRSR